MQKSLFKVLGIVALALVILPPAAFLAGLWSNESAMKTAMLVGTLLWFIAAPFWFRDEKPSA